MEEDSNTGFKDKSGRSIYVGDIVQHRLGKFGKSGGTQNFRVIEYGKNYRLINESRVGDTYGGTILTAHVSKFLIVLRSDHIRG